MSNFTTAATTIASGLFQPDDNTGADDVFCLTPLWDTNLTWHPEPGNPPDFTPCFHKTVLVYVPCAVLWLLTPVEAALIANVASPISRQFSKVPWTWLSLTKVVLTCTLIVTSVATLFMVIMSSYEVVTGADIVAPPLKISTYLASLLLLVNAKKRGHVTSGVQFLFWLLLAACQTATLGSLLYRGGTGYLTTSVAQSKILFVDCLLILVMFILNCFADNPQGYKDLQDGNRKKSPQNTSSFLNYILFAWFDPTVWRAKNAPITDSDLWDLNDEDSTRTLIPLWIKLWETEEKKMNSEEGYQHSDYGCQSNYQRLNPAQKKPGIAGCIMKAFKWNFIAGFLWQMAYVIVQFISPLILDLIIDLVKDQSQENWKGYMYTAILCLVSLLSAIFDSTYWASMKLLGLRIRTAINGAVYRKTLRLSNLSKRSMTAGDVVNLISVDTQKLQEAMLFINFMWACPLQVGLAIFFLYTYLGWPVFVGLAVLLILLPINAIVWVFMEKYQEKQMEKKDSRVRLITEVLSGAKVLKLFAWEDAFTEKIEEIRRGELRNLRAFQYLESSQFFAWNIAPFMVALSTFGTYILSYGGVLDPKVAFVSLSLFNKMRGPLYLLPFGIANLIQGGVACRRINSFLNKEEMDPDSVGHDNHKAHPIELQHASFSWGGKDEPPQLKNLNLSVNSGSLTAVVGVVGSGKSSLLSAILGNMTRISGVANVRQKEKVAYVPQQAWMQNTSLQENILFGKPLQNELYQKTLDACALRTDLEVLGGGDQTEIGEKGINVSGGQKQRISLARAVYSDSSLYLLDDPLSAVDSHVGKHIFQEVLGPNGLLQNKTRVLVTHAISYLPQMDEIFVMKDGTISERGTYSELLASGGAFADFLIEQLQLEQEKLDHFGGGDIDGEEAASMSESEVESLKHNLEITLGKDDIRLKRANEERLAAKRSRTRTFSGSSSVSLPSKGHHHHPPHSQHQQQHHQMVPELAEEVTAGHRVGQDLIVEEHAETNSVGLSVYMYYARNLGAMAVTLGTSFYFLFQIAVVAGNIWLSVWSGDEEAARDLTKQGYYLSVFGALGLLQSVAILIAILALTIGSLKASERLHKNMLDHILQSTAAFLDTTPIGRIVNRFSKDIDEIDLMLPTNIKDVSDFFFSTVATAFVVCYTNLYTLALMPVLVALALFIQIRYLTLSRQLKRMVSVTRSPINSGVTESFSGATTICAFGRVEDFVRQNDDLVEANQRYFYPEVISDSWLFSRLQTVSNLLILFVSLFSIIQRETIDPGLVGLSLTYAFTCQLDIFLLTRRFADTEKSIVSVERVREYQTTPVEAPRVLESDSDLPEMWPEDGEVEFKDYATRYRPGLDLVLRGVSFKIDSGVKVGIVGRTGAGKSSLALSIFRLIEAAEDHPGYISIDGINIAQVGLKRLRNILTIIPQDPVLFSGTLRFNLDPRNQFNDDQIWRALEIAHLKDFVMSTVDSSSGSSLDMTIYDGGENLSVGQRQLVCLARALLRKTKVLILDEATAAVDLETDDFIQETIRTEFRTCTILTIAHRIKTIMDYDKILVLNNGRVAEFDTPAALLANTASSFHAMVQDAGLQSQ